MKRSQRFARLPQWFGGFFMIAGLVAGQHSWRRTHLNLNLFLPMRDPCPS